MAKSKALTKQAANTIRAYLGQDSIKKQLSLAIPKHLTVDRLLRVSMTAIQSNEKLLECTPQSLLACIMTAAALGLEPNPITRQAALVPFWNRKVTPNRMEAQLQPMYMGLLSLVRRSGELKSVQSQVVYTNDEFTLKYGLEETLSHMPADGNRGKPRGAYCIFRYKDDAYSFDYMSTADIEKIRDRSKSKDSGPWVTDWDEMAKKTVIKRHSKLAPMSVEFSTATALDDRIHAGESQMDLMSQDDDDVIDVETEDGGETEASILFWQTFPTRVPAMKKFLEETAEAQDISVAELQAGALENKAGFTEAFVAWLDKDKKPAPGTKKTIVGFEPLPCPNDGEIKASLFCKDKCEDRTDCPSWDAYDNKP